MLQVGLSELVSCSYSPTTACALTQDTRNPDKLLRERSRSPHVRITQQRRHAQNERKQNNRVRIQRKLIRIAINAAGMLIRIPADRDRAHGNVAQEHGDEKYARPQVIVLGLVELELLFKCLRVCAVAVLLVSILLHWRLALGWRIVLVHLLAVLGRLLPVFRLTLVVRILGLLRCAAAIIVIGCLSLMRHRDVEFRAAGTRLPAGCSEVRRVEERKYKSTEMMFSSRHRLAFWDAIDSGTCRDGCTCVAAVHVISAITDQMVCCVVAAPFRFIQVLAAIGLACGRSPSVA
jgi:hypothetical protein